MMPLELSLFVLDHSARQGFIIGDARWTGGTLALEECGSRWHVRVVSSWVI